MSIPKQKANLLAWAICIALFFSVGIRGYSYNAQGFVVPNRAQITSTTTYAKLGKFSDSHSEARGDTLGRYAQDDTQTYSAVFAEAGIGVVGQIGLNLTDDKAKWNDNLVRGAAFGAGFAVLAKPLGGILKGVGNATI